MNSKHHREFVPGGKQENLARGVQAFGSMSDTNSIGVTMPIKEELHNNFVITMDESSLSTTSMKQKLKPIVIDGWKWTEHRQSQFGIPTKQLAETNGIRIPDSETNSFGHQSNAIGSIQVIKNKHDNRTDKPISISSNDMVRVTDKRRLSHFRSRKKHRKSPTANIQTVDSIGSKSRANTTNSAAQNIPVVDILAGTVPGSDRSVTTDSLRSTLQSLPVMEKKPPSRCSDGSALTEMYSKAQYAYTPPRSVSIQPSNNNMEHGPRVIEIPEIERHGFGERNESSFMFENRNHFMTSSLRESATHGRRIRRITSRRQLRHSMSELGFGKLQSYKKLELIGEGTYATVYKGYSMLLEKMVALKEIRMEKTEGAPCTAIREISLLRYLRHANIVTLHDVIFTQNSLTLVFEYIGQDLRHYMESFKNRLPLKTVKLFMFQIFRALEFCHARRILHRDLKPQNLLITKHQELKLADFGLARAKSIPTKTYSSEVATLWYRPPDVLLGDRNYSGHIDIWGAGCIFYEMATGRTAFAGESKDNQVQVIFKKLDIPPESYWPGLRQIEKFQQLVLDSLPGETTTYAFNCNSSSVTSGSSDSAAEVQAYVHHVRKLLTERVTRLDTIGIDLLCQCLQVLGSRRITAEQALTHSYFDGILPKGIKVQQLSPEQSVFVSPDDLTRTGKFKGKMNNFGYKKQLAASMDDIRIGTVPAQVVTSSKTRALQPIVKTRSKSSQNMSTHFSSEMPKLIVQNRGRTNQLNSFSVNDNEVSKQSYDLLKQPTPRTRPRSSLSFTSKSNDRHVTFEVIGYDESLYQKVSTSHPFSQSGIERETRGSLLDKNDQVQIPNSPVLSSAGSITGDQILRVNQRPGTPIQLIRMQDKNSSNSRVLGGIPITFVNGESQPSPLSNYKLYKPKRSHTQSYTNNGQVQLNQTSLPLNSFNPVPVDSSNSRYPAKSMSLVRTSTNKPLNATNYAHIGDDDESCSRDLVKVFPIQLNNQRPTIVRVIRLDDQKRANEIYAQQCNDEKNSQPMNFNGALEILHNVCQ